MSEPIPYDPNCLHCRRDAAKDSAGVTRLCETHKADEIARLQREVAEAHSDVARLNLDRLTVMARALTAERDLAAVYTEIAKAGITMTCDTIPEMVAVIVRDLAEAREKLAEREATVDILVQRVHERDAELGELKRSGKTERRFTNDYINALHKAERERDEACERANVLSSRLTAAECALSQRIALRREIEAALGITTGATDGDALARGLAAIRALHAERDTLRALLVECRDWLAILESPVEDIHVATHAEMLARLDAALDDVGRLQREVEAAQAAMERAGYREHKHTAASAIEGLMRERDEAITLLRDLHTHFWPSSPRSDDLRDCERKSVLLARLDAALGKEGR